MSLETRSSSALFKRAEQLKRWEQSETNREPAQPRQVARKIKFSADCVFLAACAAGDKEEVIRLLQKGADINTGNVDGLTALHQMLSLKFRDLVSNLEEAPRATLNLFQLEHTVEVNSFPKISDFIETFARCRRRFDCLSHCYYYTISSILEFAKIDSIDTSPMSTIYNFLLEVTDHGACIDDDLDMVEFLVEQGADINRGDNEGWTPLHATASCGFISIAKYLIEQGCNLAAVNNDGELALDIAESDEMEDMLQQHINKAGIDCDQARSEEERSMLNDARAWRSGAPGKDAMHPRSGATALHVAAAKGYINVMNILLQARCDVNAQDYDGWTPLHGAAHWGQLEASKLLVENFCDMDIKNYAGQTAFDVADTDILKGLEELKKKQQALLKDHPQIINKKQPAIPKKRVSTNNENIVIAQEGVEIYEEETPNKVKKVELEIQSEKEDSSTGTNSDVEKKNRVNRDETASHSPTPSIESNKVPNQAPIVPIKQETENNEEGSIPSWRRSGSFRSRTQDPEAVNSLSSRIEDKEKSLKSPTSPDKIKEEPEVVLRRTHSFETDQKFYEQYLALRARIKASSCPTLHRCNPTTPTHNSPVTARSASLRETYRKKDIKLNLDLSKVPQGNNISPTSISNKSSPVTSLPAFTNFTATTTTVASPLPGNQIRSSQPADDTTVVYTLNNSVTTPITPTTPGGSKLSPGNIFKNFFKSFVPPVRDEESETQRKAHAKRVRETRRSTQGVTLDEIKSAEQLVKKKQQQNNDPPTTTAPSTQPAASVSNTASITATITTATPTTVTASKTSEETNLPERRPSWRLRVDNGSKFQLEDANNRSSDTTAYIRRPSGGSNVPRPSSAPVDTITASTAETTVTLPLRRPLKPPEDKEQDKENDSRNAQATQAVIQRRRRPKRRSTGVVHVDMDEIDPEKQDTSAGGDCDDSKINHSESGQERSGRSSRLGSVSSLASETPSSPARTKSVTSENGELDYKKLYEESQAENERLREKLRRSDDQLKEVRSLLDKAQSAQNKNNLSETEKRERRAMERKLSEMEEELKVMEQLKCENQKLKDENGALIRVISKLSK